MILYGESAEPSGTDWIFEGLDGGKLLSVLAVEEKRISSFVVDSPGALHRKAWALRSRWSRRMLYVKTARPKQVF